MKGGFRAICTLVFLTAFLIPVSANALICDCVSCSNCTVMLNDAGCDTVRLTQDLYIEQSTWDSACIDVSGLNSKVLDCSGHMVHGKADTAGNRLMSPAIHIKNSLNMTVQNCVLKGYNGRQGVDGTYGGFNHGIKLYGTRNSTLRNNTLIDHHNQGIYLHGSTFNTVENSYAENNWIGFYCSDGAHYNTLRNNQAYRNKFGYNFRGSYNEMIGNIGCENVVNNLPRDASCYPGIGNYGSGNYLDFVEDCPGILHETCEWIGRTIDSCRVLNKSDMAYELAENLFQDLDSSCIIIIAENVTVDCKGKSITSSSTAYIAGIYSNQKNTTIKNCNVTGISDGWGIYLQDGNDSYVFNNTINSNMYGFETRNASHNLISNNTFDSNELGVFLRISSFDNIIQDNTFINNYRTPGTAGTNGAGVHLLEGAINTTIQNNRFIEGNYYSIQISRSAGSLVHDAYTKVLNNEINNDRGGIYVTSNKNLIKGNILINSNTGISLTSNASENVFENNILLSNSGMGFLIIVNSSNNIFKNNYINESFYGFFSDTGANNNTLDNNSIFNSIGDGIYIAQDSGNVTIINNTVRLSGQRGLYSIKNTPGLLIQDNDFCSNTEDAYCAEIQTFIDNQCESNNGCGGSCLSCGGAPGPKPVSSCSALDSANSYYYLTQDIVQPIDDSCIKIFAENVTFDCQGNSVTSPSTAYIAGIYSNQPNTVIRNCTVFGLSEGWGIFLQNADGSMILNNSLNNNYFGFEARYSSDMRIVNNTMNSNYYGLFLDTIAFNNTIQGNVFCSNNLTGRDIDAHCLNDQIFIDNKCDSGYVCGSKCFWNCDGTLFDPDPGPVNRVNISSCQELNQTNTIYTLTNNVVRDAGENCFTVSAGHVTVDCQGHSITSGGSAGVAKGVYSDQLNTTIKNCNIDMSTAHLGYGISLNGADNAYIFNNVLNNQYYGLFSQSSANVQIINNRANSNEQSGFTLSGVNPNNVLINNAANLNGQRGFFVSARNSVMTGNTGNSNGQGLYLATNPNNALRDNNFCFNSEYDVRCYSAPAEFTNNTCNINIGCDACNNCTEQSTETQSVQFIAKDEAALLEFQAASSVENIRLEVKEDMEETVSIAVTERAVKPHEIPGKPSNINEYVYIRIEASSNLEEKIQNATVTFKVAKSWLSNNGITRNDIRIYSYNENTGIWDSVFYSISGEDSGSIHYSITTGHFSDWLVGAVITGMAAPGFELSPLFILFAAVFICVISYKRFT